MKVLALVAEAFGGYGGIARSTQDILLAISRAIPCEIDIIPRVASGEIGRPSSRIRQHAPRQGKLRFSATSLKFAVTSRPDLVYCGHLFMAPLAAIVASMSRAKLIIHLHGIEVWKRPSVLQRMALERADLLLCVSNNTAEKVREFVGVCERRVGIIYNTINDRLVPRERVLARRSFDINEERDFVLLTVSRLDSRQRHKGHDLVIGLLPRVNEMVSKGGKKILYLIAGDGDDRIRLESLAANLGVARMVRFLGRVPDDRLPDLYSAADLYVMPSTGEGFGIAFVEAMSCGTPAIGLDVGGASDALGNGELGCAARESDFEQELEAMVMHAANRRNGLAEATRETFGRPAFEKRVAIALNRLFSS